MKFINALKDKLQKTQLQKLTRKHKTLHSAQSVNPIIEGKQCLSFNSNDYLGHANHPKLNEALVKASKKCGVGSGSAHLVAGHHQYHAQLENLLAEKTAYPSALLFSTGYMANLAIASLFDRHDSIIQDKLNHASLIDAAKLSSAKLKRYAHNDLSQASNRLKQPAEQKILMTDAVFSMDGDEAPLVDLASLCSQHNGVLMIDDAHGFGVLGSSGAGSVEQSKLTVNDVPIYMATLGKAIGSFGAFVAADENIIEALIHYSRPYVYTTATPPAIAAATIASINLLNEEAWRREKLLENIQYFKQCALDAKINLMPSNTAIQPVMLGDNELALKYSAKLWRNDIFVSAIRPPTVPDNTARLRVVLCTEHTHDHIDRLVDVLSSI